MKFDPISLTELKENYGIAKPTASAWFKEHFGGHQKYRAACRQNRGKRLQEKLKELNGDYAPYGQGATDRAEEDHDDDEGK